MDDERFDPALIRGLTQPRLSRRDVLKYAGLGAGALSLSSILAACGTKSGGGAGGGSASPAGFDWSAQQIHHKLDFANWPYYIDTHKGKHPSLELFQQQTGIKVNYRVPINDNAAFYQTLRPYLEQKKSPGWDLIVLTNGPQLSQLIANDWLIPLDVSKLPNFQKYASPSVKDPTYDPKNTFTIAWQSGLTGIAFSPQATQALGHEPDSIADLWNPVLKGHVGMMSDNTELGSAGLLYTGVDPATSTPTQWKAAADALTKQQQSNVVRNYYDQGYIKSLEDGDTWISQAWSGDVFLANQSGYPDLKFIVPKEGAMFWTDNMMIPVGATNPLDALTYMDFVYEPKVAAMLTNYIWYITPVPASKPLVANMPGGKSVAASPLVYPDAAMQANFREYYVFKGQADLNEWNNTFEPIIQG
jgi:spermidine/putrescine transport system substrate-binding protein